MQQAEAESYKASGAVTSKAFDATADPVSTNHIAGGSQGLS